MDLRKNKKAQQILVFLMIAVMVFIMASQFARPLRDAIGDAKNTTTLNESNPNISAVNKAAIITLDMGFFYFLSTVIATGLAIITGRKNITGIIAAVFIFIIVTVLIVPLKSLVIMFRNSSHLNCAATDISVAIKLTCIFVDLWLFYFVVIVIASAITYIISKRVIPKFTGEQE